ncbi:uncharacterized protein LOC129765221 isoform X2 [Toxorhynchites rutilus septentrionalis]|uniref:uncharacterized protein LOC129765221 isoform X2 n=1 Tax=Toxorhynchites rutilus septentrionalis TaxID=329112 RepID=UPI00247AC86B|nr:uncharacterized protein LOC129765221 isoform X2 [Toxorhynchites rutilus septentrionalis]
MGDFGVLLPPKLFLSVSTLLFFVIQVANSQYPEVADHHLRPCELESLLRDLTYPEAGYEMHAAALRNQLRNILERDPNEAGYQSLDEYGGYDGAGPYEDKRSYRSLLRDGPVFGKRNLGALARAGLLRSPNNYLKRSIATLAKNGQLPSREPDSAEEDSTGGGGWSDDKRNIGSAFKSGYMLNGKRNIASLARKYELPGKRNIQALLRNGMLPSLAPKRNMQSLARDNALPHYGGSQENKRNIQTMVRDWNLPKQQNNGGGIDNEKRNIQSLKNSQGHNGGVSGGRRKRGVYYDDEALEDSTPEILEPVYQSAPLDYEELLDAMTDAYPYYLPTNSNPPEEKRFLGSLARSGMLNRYHRYSKRWSMDDLYDDTEQDDDDSVEQANGEDDDEDDDVDDEDDIYESPRKRHIASLVRSGWMPSFRPSRGSSHFSRSGRARSQIVEYYRQPERLRQPTAGVCRRCDTISEHSGFRSALSPYFGSSSSGGGGSWGAPGLQSTWGSTPPRVAALHWRRFRDPSPAVRRTTRGIPLLRRFQ